eukprot:364531-Chlamydomonas_euryale.AAC.7
MLEGFIKLEVPDPGAEPSAKSLLVQIDKIPAGVSQQKRTFVPFEKFWQCRAGGISVAHALPGAGDPPWTLARVTHLGPWRG